MTRWLIFPILFFSFACTHNQKTPTPATATPAQPTYTTPRPSKVPKNLAQHEAVVLSEDFRVPLLEWMKKNPRANYSKLAREVQKFIKNYGVIYYVNIKELPERDDKYQKLVMNDGTHLLFDTEIGTEGPCGEFFSPVSVAGFNDGKITFLTNHGPKTLSRDTKGLFLERTLVRKSGDPEPVSFYLPTTDVPWNVSSDGKYVAWKYDLKMSVVEGWWRNLMRRFRDLREERPFVLIRITQDDFVVETNERALIPGQYDQVESGTEGILRYSYKPRGVTADISAGCH